MGSVKSLKVLEAPTENAMGRGVFTFSDDYSIFDYGKMPDVIEGKGAALCAVSAHNFRLYEKRGLRTHLIGLPSANQMEVYLVRKIMPESLSETSSNYLIPLEIIFRDELPEGSSVFRRMKRGDMTYQDMGLDHEPVPGEKLNAPILDVSTKFEPVDRYFKNLDAAAAYAKLSSTRLSDLKKQALLINSVLKSKCESIGWRHLDGKVEAGVDPLGNVVWVDASGTYDEDRFDFKGHVLSKQVLRNYYKGGEWHKALQAAQDAKKPVEEWPAPPKLPSKLINFVSALYKAGANEWTGEQVFPGVKSLDSLFAEDFVELKNEGLVK
ncbi:MAG: phosphoribosylaminoimidazolesuccinocarboxamide synthase [Candidatus Diapherotrites archaeon]|nr:phosphoribosylaminoimidazolesuccinocarboxamide synthase [Candidatus Diapherotrites archaeon]